MLEKYSILQGQMLETNLCVSWLKGFTHRRNRNFVLKKINKKQIPILSR